MESSAAMITSEISKSLPDKLHVGVTYPISFSFRNSGNAAARSVRVTLEHSNGFKLKYNECASTCGHLIRAGAACKIEGSFTPRALGTEFIEAKLSYVGGTPASVRMEAGVVEKPPKKPRLVMVGEQGYRRISGDGLAWTNKDFTGGSGIEPRYETLKAIAWSERLSQFLIVATNVSGRWRTHLSQDGLTWQAPQIQEHPTYSPNDVIWNEDRGEYISVGSAGNSACIATSVDGKSWAYQVLGGTPVLNAVLWNKQLGQYVSVGNNGAVLVSFDEGKSWMPQLSPFQARLNAIAWSASRQLYVAATEEQRVLTSTTGTVWTLHQDSNLPSTALSITWSDNFAIYVIAGKGGPSPYISVSSNGTTWQPVVREALTVQKVIWAPLLKKFYAVSQGGALIYFSDNTHSWEIQTLSDKKGEILGMCEGSVDV
jgi:photosystem II stability/assembly factor-like uncharacterized protein